MTTRIYSGGKIRKIQGGGRTYVDLAIADTSEDDGAGGTYPPVNEDTETRKIER